MIRILLCALIAGCGSPSIGDPDAGPLPDTYVPTPECSADLDCDDGLFCTGIEACVAGHCEAERVDCDDGIECTDDFCSEERHRCESAPPDVDGDGFGAATCLDDRGDPLGDDCDDTNVERFPGNRESCDDDDEDCDPTTRGGTDDDSDGYESAACCNDGMCGDDCDDARGSIHPLGTEVCDGLDQDCDAMIDDGVTIAGFYDGDLDGRGDDTMAMMRCPGARMFALEGGDCDDTNYAICPDQPEICDGIRNDCQPLAADALAVAVDWFGDTDGDGFGSPSSGVTRSCAPVANASLRSSDCDDSEAAINPAAAEACDGIDNDCRGGANFAIAINDTEDDDGDGIVDLACGTLGADCDDTDPATGPGEIERCDLRDNDCDDVVDEGASSAVYYRDRDGDGFGSSASGAIIGCMASAGYVASGGDCDDARPERSPGARELCNLQDDDCDATIDETPDAECLRPGVDDALNAESSGVTPGGYVYVTNGITYGQTFTIVTPGQLIGIEIEMIRRWPVSSVASARIEVRDPSGTLVATRRLPDASVPDVRVPLVAGRNGPTYVDLRPEALMVESGEVWSWLLIGDGIGTCVGGMMGTCVERADRCSRDPDCGAYYGLVITYADAYTGGSLQCTGTCSFPDAFFRTVVRPR